MRSWVFRNRARLEALCGRPAPVRTRPAPGTLVHQGKSARRRGPGVIVLVPARRRR